MTKIFREWAYNRFHFPGKSEAKNAGGVYNRNIEKKRGMCDEKNEDATNDTDIVRRIDL